jgi:hypothetical protein
VPSYAKETDCNSCAVEEFTINITLVDLSSGATAGQWFSRFSATRIENDNHFAFFFAKKASNNNLSLQIRRNGF